MAQNFMVVLRAEELMRGTDIMYDRFVLIHELEQRKSDIPLATFQADSWLDAVEQLRSSHIMGLFYEKPAYGWIPIWETGL